ncbi:hypothetical protein LPB86_05500 [Pedobacter sp. MC2016-14]|uniref:hypothetical protein n=1 Tax=Pedobacter sp. MC2016-14 TaxID=2897327 RepID=UPI001E5A43A0|nr:hypothetical protein [Pedobacter sp. MC2016-14]MCD0487672.1 hypothetical protein [Pedobacter sp. MC2016-14]
MVDPELKAKPAFYAVQRLAEATAGLTLSAELKTEVYHVADRPDDYPIKWDEVTMAAPGTIPVYGFKDEKNKPVLAMWSAERTDGDFSSRIATLKIDVAGKAFKKITALDLMTGISNDGPFTLKEGNMVLDKMTIEDHPVLIYLL